VPDPLGSYRVVLQQLRGRAEQELVILAYRPTSRPTPVDHVHRELYAGIGSALTSEFLGRSRIGSSVGRAIASSAQVAQRQRDAEAARQTAQEQVREARQLVQSISGVVGPRYAQSLHRLLAQAESAHRPDTSIRKVLEVVSRIEGWQAPPAPISERPTDALQTLERALRRCIEEKLSRLTDEWWTTLVPTKVRLHAERRMASRERVWPWLNDSERRPIEYLDFPDYARIILEEQNWQRAFSTVFVDRDALKVKLHELEPIRNDLAHSRQITTANADRLRLYAYELASRVSR
jgi:hypothetical protein